MINSTILTTVNPSIQAMEEGNGMMPLCVTNPTAVPFLLCLHALVNKLQREGWKNKRRSKEHTHKKKQ
jgi:hypothetical protein